MYHTSHHHHKIKKKARRILQKKEELSPSDCDDLQSNYAKLNNSLNTEIYGIRVDTNTSAAANQNFIFATSTMPISLLQWPPTTKLSYVINSLKWPKSLVNSVLVVLCIFASLGSQVQGKPHPQPPPPLPPAGFIDFDNLPVTRFSCEGKVIGGYYADVETGCQMFHVCTLGQKDEVQDIKFLCLNGTVFDQETRVCERVDEVDCSKAEQYYDLNLDLYVPYVATPKPPEPSDLEEEDDFIRPVSTHKPPPSPPPTTTRPTTTTRATTTTTKKTTTASSPTRSRISAPLPSPTSNSKSNSGENSNSNKGFSSFNYYLKTPHSHVASGYNSESQQSYIFNHNPSSEEKEGSYSVSESESESSSGRKIPTGPKTIVYGVSSSSARPRVPPTTTSTRAPVIIKPEEYEEQYADEYYDDELPLEYDISSSTTGSRSQQQQQQQQQVSSNQKNYELSQSSNKNLYQEQYGRSKGPMSTYDYRDGRSASLSSKSDRGGRGRSLPSSSSSSSSKGSETKSHVSVAISSSKSTRSPPFQGRTTARSTPRPSTTTSRTTTPRPVQKTTAEPEPYYYDDDYPEDNTELQEQDKRPQAPPPSIMVRMPNSISSTTLRTSSGKSGGEEGQETTGPSGPLTGPSGDNVPEYYDDGEGNISSVNVNDHHFTHVDVPRIPFAKPNVPRVLVTNGKPFLPRLTRHIAQQQTSQSTSFSKELLQQQKLRRPYRQSFWDTFLEQEYIRKKRNSSGHQQIMRKSA